MKRSRMMAGALAIGLLVAALSVIGGSPASAKGKHGAVAWPSRLVSCTYAGRTLRQVKVNPPRVSMDKKLAKAGGTAQYVGVRVVLQGLKAGRWKKVAKRPTKRSYAATVKVHPRRLTSVKHAKLLTFKGSTLRSAYSSFRTKVTLQWYAYNGHTIRGQVSRKSSACARTLPPPPPHVVSIDAGDAYACAKMSNSTARCWGAGASGRLGVGSTANHPRPITPRGIGTVLSVAAGQATACALLTNKTVKCWGTNGSGQVGDGTKTGRTAPVTVPGLSNIDAVYVGQSATCAMVHAASLECWGVDTLGQVGDSGKTNVLKPKSLGLSSIRSAAAGRDQACSVNTSSQVQCWGSNYFGQLGPALDKDKTSDPHPKTTVSATYVGGASAVVSGNGHNCAIVVDQAVKCWGANGSTYQLGTGASGNTSKPTQVSGLSSGVTSLSAYGNTTCAVRGGAVYCWGANGYGQLGNGTTSVFTTPRRVAGLSHVIGVAVGGRSAYAWDAAGHVWAWGDNLLGELATGDYTSHLGPIAVSIH